MYQFLSLSEKLQGCDPDDFVQVQYSIDGGAWTNFSTNGLIYDDFSTATASQTGLSGNTLRLQIIFSNAGESYYADNISVTGTPPVSPTVTDPTNQLVCDGASTSAVSFYRYGY